MMICHCWFCCCVCFPLAIVSNVNFNLRATFLFFSCVCHQYFCCFYCCYCIFLLLMMFIELLYPLLLWNFGLLAALLTNEVDEVISAQQLSWQNILFLFSKGSEPLPQNASTHPCELWNEGRHQSARDGRTVAAAAGPFGRRSDTQ